MVEVQEQQERMVAHEAELSAQCVGLETAKCAAEAKLASCEGELQAALWLQNLNQRRWRKTA